MESEITNLTVLLDEPSRGLHPREVDALFSALSELRDEGNTVIVVEHDLGIIEKADHIIEVGPGPGVNGGKIVAEGSPIEISASDTATGRWIREKKHKAQPRKRVPEKWMIIKGANENNLKAETVEIPLNCPRRSLWSIRKRKKHPHNRHNRTNTGSHTAHHQHSQGTTGTWSIPEPNRLHRNGH